MRNWGGEHGPPCLWEGGKRQGRPHLDVVALRQHHVLVGQELLDALLGYDVLHLRKEGGGEVIGGRRWADPQGPLLG